MTWEALNSEDQSKCVLNAFVGGVLVGASRPQALQLSRHILGARSACSRLCSWAGNANVGQASNCKVGKVLRLTACPVAGRRIGPVVGRQMGQWICRWSWLGAIQGTV